MINELKALLSGASPEQKSDVMFLRASEMYLLCEQYLAGNPEEKLEKAGAIRRLERSTSDIDSNFSVKSSWSIVREAMHIGLQIIK